MVIYVKLLEYNKMFESLDIKIIFTSKVFRPNIGLMQIIIFGTYFSDGKNGMLMFHLRFIG